MQLLLAVVSLNGWLVALVECEALERALKPTGQAGELLKVSAAVDREAHPRLAVTVAALVL